MQQKFKYSVLGIGFFIIGIVIALSLHHPAIISESAALNLAPVTQSTTTTSQGVLTTPQPQSESRSAQTPTTQTAPAPTQQIAVTLKTPKVTYSLSAPIGASVYDALIMAKKERGLSFTTKSYPALGFLIDSIDGVRGGDTPGYYWIYYVNGKKAVVGISNYKLAPNDIVEWKYESEN